MKEALSELKDRFFSEAPATDPDQEKGRIDRDHTREVFARAEAFARMGPPIDATLDPVTAPENVQMRLTSDSRDIPQPNEMEAANLHSRGSSRGLQAGKNALVEEAGWSHQRAEALKLEAERGQMTEGQFMRVVESELQRSETSGRMVSPPTSSGPDGVDRRRGSGRFVSDQQTDSGVGRNEKGQFQNVEDLVHSNRGRGNARFGGE